MAFWKGDSLDDWNPMEDDFNSVAFNSYDRGYGMAIPTDRLPSWQKRVSHATNQTYTLHIGKIPEGLKESGLFNIFSKYGEVLRVYRSHSKSGRCFGFVDYATLKEAELAIREVDARPPLQLHVSFSMTKQDKQDQNKLKEEEIIEYLNITVEANNKSSLQRKKLESDDRGSDYFGRQSNFSFSQGSHTVTGVGRGALMKPPYDYGLRDLSNSQLPRFRITTTREGREITYINDADRKQHYGNHCARHCPNAPLLPSCYYCDQDSIHGKTASSCGSDNDVPLRNELLDSSHTEKETSHSSRPVLRRPHSASLHGNSFVEKPVSHIDTLLARGPKEGLLPTPHIDTSNSGLFPISRPNSRSDNCLLPTPQPHCRIANVGLPTSLGGGEQHLEQNKARLASHLPANQNAKDVVFTLPRRQANILQGKDMRVKSDKLNESAAEKILGGPCENCHTFGTSCCSACKAWYCSRDCQVKHWPAHQQICSKTSGSGESAASTHNDQAFSGNRQGINKGNDSIIKDKKGNGRQQNKQGSWKTRPKTKRQDMNPQVKTSRKVGNDYKSELFTGTLDSKGKKADTSWKESAVVVPVKKHSELKYEDLDTVFTEVKVCSGYSPDEIWLHKVPEAETNIQNVSKIMQECCEKASVYHPKVGEICGALYLLDKTWCRVKIKEVRQNECITYFLDFGNTEITPVSKIRRLTDECLSLPAQAIVCKLAFIQPFEDTWGFDAVKLLSLSISSSPIKARAVTRLDDFKYEVELIDAEGNQINEKLVKAGYAKIKEKEKCEKDTLLETGQGHVSTKLSKESRSASLDPNNKLAECITSLPSLLSSLHAGEELSLAVAFATGDKTDFWVHPVIPQASVIMEKLLQLNELQNFKHNEEFRPKVGDLVAARSVSDGSWYRASVICVETNSYRVFYVDFGNQECVTMVLPLQSELRLVASLCIHCLVRGSLSSESTLLLNKHIVEGECLPAKITSVNKSEVHMDVRIPNSGDTVLCSLTGYSWDYSLSREESNTVPSGPSSMPIKLDIEESKSSDATSLPSLVSGLLVGEEVSLAIAFVTEENTDFWAHPMIDQTAEIMEKLVPLNELQNHKNDGAFSVKVGDLIAAQSLTDGSWYRASVLRAEANSFYVRYVDYGNEESVITIAPLPLACKSIASIAIHCLVSGNVSSENKLLLKEYIVEGGCLSVKVMSVCMNKVCMDVWSPKDDGVVLCSLTGYSWDYLPPKGEPDVPITSLSSLPINNEIVERGEASVPAIPPLIAKLQKDSKVHLGVVHTTDKKMDFWAQPLMEETPEIIAKLKELNELAGDVKFFSANSGDIVVAQSIDDSMWYRAYVLHAKDDNFHVKYIDYGNEETVTKVIPLPSEYMSIPSLAVHCIMFETISSINEHMFEEHLSAGLVLVKITSTDKDKIDMALISMENNSLMGTLIAYPWYHDLPSTVLPTHDSSEKTSHEEAAPSPCPQPSTKELDLSMSDDNAVPVKINTVCENSNNTSVPTSSLFSILQKDTDIRMAIAFVVKGKTDFWAQPLTAETAEMLEQLMKLNEHNSSEKSSYCPNVGDIVAALSVADGCWYRAYVLQTENEKHGVQYIDYGNKEEVKKVASLLPQYSSIPPLAIHCIPQILPSVDEQAFERLVCLNSIITVRVTSIIKDKIEMKLLNPDDTALCTVTGYPWNCDVQKLATSEMPQLNASVAREPLSPSQSKDFTDVSTINRYKALTFTNSIITRLQTDSDVSLGIAFMVEGGTDFWAQPFVTEISEIMQQLVELNKCALLEEKDFCPSVNDVIVALSVADGSWYRASILEMAGSKYRVRYIDYGNEELVEKVVPLPLPEYASIPSLAIYCFLDKALSPATEQIFNKLIYLNNTVTVRVISVAKDKIEMKLLSSDDASPVCTLIGCPWYHDIQKLAPSDTPKLDSFSSTNEEDAASKKSKTCSSDLQDSLSFHTSLLEKSEDEQMQRSNELSKPMTSSVINSLQKNMDVSLGIIYMSENGSDFWAQPLTNTVGEMMQQLVKLEECAPKEDEEFSPKLHDIVAALSVADGCWYRACILRIRNGKYYVRYIDYGNKEEVEKVVPLLADYMSIPSLTIHCILHETLSPAAEQIYRELVCVNSTVSARVISLAEDSIKLDLLNPNDNSVACTVSGYPWHYDILSETSELNTNPDATQELTTPETPLCSSHCIVDALSNDRDTAEKPKEDQDAESQKTEFIPPVLSVITSLSCNMEVALHTIMILEDSFWFLLEADSIGNIAEAMNDFETHAKRLEGREFLAKARDTVIAQSPADGCWYRAYVLSVGEKYTVRYIDYGNEEIVSSVFPPLSEHISVPSPVVNCFVTLAEEQELATKHIVANAEQLYATILTVNNEKIEMNLLATRNGVPVCKLIGYPWYHGLGFRDNRTEPLTSLEKDTNALSASVTGDLVNHVTEEKRLSVPSVLRSLPTDIDTILVSKPNEKSFSAVIGEEETLQAVMKIETIMAEKYDLECKKTMSLAPGDIVAAYSPSELCWRRAYILKSLGSSYSVHYIDYGEDERVTAAYPLEEQHCLTPSPAVFCTLDEVPDDVIIHLKKVVIPNALINVEIVGREEDKLYFQLKISGEEIICKLTAHSWDYQLRESISSKEGSTLNDHCRESQHRANSHNYISTGISNREEVHGNSLEPGTKQDSVLIKHLDKHLANAKYCDEQDRHIIIENNCGDLWNGTDVISSVLPSLKPDREIVLYVVVPSDEKLKFWACVCDDELGKAIIEMQTSVADTESDEIIRPKVGDIIVAKSPLYDEWYRAYVLKDNGENLQVRYVDYGNEESVAIYRALKSVHLGVLSPALYCTVEETSIGATAAELDKLFTVGNKFPVKVSTASTDKVQLSVISNDGAIMCTLSGLPWYYDLRTVDSKSNETDIPKKNIDCCVMYSDIKTLSVTSIDNINVKIVHIINLQNLFVQSVSQIPEISKLVRDVTEYCKNVPMASYHPRTNEMVCAKHSEDSMWYRGFVKSISTSGSFVIHFIDFGNDEEIDSSYLKPLPKHFSTFPAFAICVNLQLPSILPAVKVQKLLRYQIWKATVINAETACIKLFSDKGLSVTEVLKAELALDDQRNNNNTETQNPGDKVLTEKETKKFYYVDCPTAELPMGEVTIVITSVVAPNIIFCCLADKESISALECLNNSITIHCTNSKSSDFCPETGEVCLAKYTGDGLWYRAVPISYVKNSFHMLFVDFGNVDVVQLEDTRPVFPEFMKLPVQGICCALAGTSSETEWTEDVIQLLLSLVPQQKPLKVNVFEKNESDVYIIDIPSVSGDQRSKCFLKKSSAQ